MNVSATIKNSKIQNDITVISNSIEKKLNIPGKQDGKGSYVNGAELLFLSLATCFCNDAYREAEKKNIDVQSVEVKVTGEFGQAGEAGYNIRYEAKITAPQLSQKEIDDFIKEIDAVAEIHKTLRQGVDVQLQYAQNL